MRALRLLRLGLLLLLACGLAGCSQKSGSAISARDVAQAMPEFMLVLPPGATNVFLERHSQPRVSVVYYKLTVPRASLTNFLTLSGLNGEFLPMPAGIFGRQPMPLPGGWDALSAANWLGEMRHADAWDPGKGNSPLRMGVIKTSAKSSPNEQVFLMILLDDSTGPQAKVYLQYCRGPKLR